MSFESNAPVDPRVQVELEKLNTATDNINKYEVELDDAKCEFKRLLAESVEKIKQSAHKLGNSIQAAKPYYEARLYAAQLAKEAQQAATNYEKAKSVHAAAKEMVYLAEQGLGEKSTLDTACQEMLSHAASRVNQSQVECTEARNVLKICELKQEVANNRVAKLQSQLKSAIKASSYNIRRKLLLMNLLAYQHDLLVLPYYETRANYNGLLKAQKGKITDLETRVSESKMTYNEALKNLERISEEIHKMRQEKKNCALKLNLERKLYDNNDDANSEANNSISNSSGYGSQQGKYQEKPQYSAFCGTQETASEIGEHQEFSSSSNNSGYSSRIETYDEYLEFPPKLSTKSSPIKQKQLEPLDCPHLLKDFNLPSAGENFIRKRGFEEHPTTSSPLKAITDNLFDKKNYHSSNNSSAIFSSSTSNSFHGAEGKGARSLGSNSYPFISSSSSPLTSTSTPLGLVDDIEQWTEIRLSNSDESTSSSSGYSHHSVIEDHLTPNGSDNSSPITVSSTSSSSDNTKKVTCTTVFNTNTNNGLLLFSNNNENNIENEKITADGKKKSSSGESGITTWITRSSSFKSSGRRQSLDLLIDAGDRVKDVFTSSFQRVGKTLERRNSESEVNNDNSEFFLFSSSRSDKDTLSDEQVENLLLNDDENGDCVLKAIVNNISK